MTKSLTDEERRLLYIINGLSLTAHTVEIYNSFCVEAKTPWWWFAPSLGSVWVKLDHLEYLGLISSEVRCDVLLSRQRPRRYYKLTDAGAVELQRTAGNVQFPTAGRRLPT
jgi:DNA-binding PadR family transcriptional regulator